VAADGNTARSPPCADTCHPRVVAEARQRIRSFNAPAPVL